MKFDITPGSVAYPEMTEKLQAQFPDYTFKMRGKQFLVAAKTSSIGANIVIRKKRIQVAGNFPTIGGTLLFVLCIILLGVLIPIIIYFAAFHKKMKALETEIGAFLEQEYAPGQGDIT